MTERCPILPDTRVRMGNTAQMQKKKTKHTSERIVVACTHYRPPARVPVGRSDRFVVFAFRSQCCRGPFWSAELLDVLQVKLKNAIALSLSSRMRMEIHTRNQKKRSDK